MSSIKEDVIGKALGNFGKWQLKTILIIFLCKIPTSWFMAVILYTAPAPNNGDFWCQRPTQHSTNTTNPSHVSHPLHMTGDKEFKIDFCHVYKDYGDRPDQLYQFVYKDKEDIVAAKNNGTIIPCDKFVFNTNYRSLISEFNLICSRSLLLAVSQCSHIFGLLIGGIVAYYMLKMISPKRLMLTGMICQVVFGPITGMVGTFGLHITFRCLSALACALMYTAGTMIMIDITGGRAKTISILMFELFWSIGLILLPALSIFVNSWSQLYVVISMPTLILIFLHRLIPDSPRWLIQHGHVEKTKEILLKAAAANKRTVSDDLEVSLQILAKESSSPQPEVTWTSLWDGRPRLYLMIALHFAWAVYVLQFNTLVLNVRTYGETHIHMNTVAIGFSEMVGVFIALYLLLYTRRKWLWASLINIALGLVAFSTWAIPSSITQTRIVALTMIGCILVKIAASVSLSLLITCSAEFVVPGKRKMLGISLSIWSRTWFLWAPFINTINKPFGDLAPLSVFASFAVVGGLLTLVIFYGTYLVDNNVKAVLCKSANTEEKIQVNFISVNGDETYMSEGEKV